MDSAHIERAVLQACMRLLGLPCGSRRRRHGAAACADIRMLRLRSAQRCMALRRASNCASAISCASGHTSRARLSFGSGCMRRTPRRARSSACCARPSSRSTMNGCGRGNHAAATCLRVPSQAARASAGAQLCLGCRRAELAASDGCAWSERCSCARRSAEQRWRDSRQTLWMWPRPSSTRSLHRRKLCEQPSATPTRRLPTPSRTTGAARPLSRRRWRGRATCASSRASATGQLGPLLCPSFGPPVSDGGRGFKSLRCAHARAAPLRALIISGGGRLGPTTRRGVVCHGMGLP